MSSKKQIFHKLNQLDKDLKRLKEDIDSHYSQETKLQNSSLDNVGTGMIVHDTPDSEKSKVKVCSSPDIIDLSKYIECNSEDFFKTKGGIEVFDEKNDTRYFKLKPTLINKKFDNFEIHENDKGEFVFIQTNQGYGLYFQRVIIPKEVADVILNLEKLRE